MQMIEGKKNSIFVSW